MKEAKDSGTNIFDAVEIEKHTDPISFCFITLGEVCLFGEEKDKSIVRVKQEFENSKLYLQSTPVQRESFMKMIEPPLR